MFTTITKYLKYFLNDSIFFNLSTCPNINRYRVPSNPNTTVEPPTVTDLQHVQLIVLMNEVFFLKCLQSSQYSFFKLTDPNGTNKRAVNESQYLNWKNLCSCEYNVMKWMD